MQVRIFHLGGDLESQIKAMLEKGYKLIRETPIMGENKYREWLLCVFEVA